MGMGFLGAMEGLGKSVQEQGKAWADDLKKKRVLESKDKYARELKKEDREFEAGRDEAKRKHDMALEEKRGEREIAREERRGEREVARERERGEQDRLTAEEKARLGLGVGSTESAARRAQAILDARDQYRDEVNDLDEDERPSFQSWLNDNGMGDLLQPRGRASLKGGSRPDSFAGDTAELDRALNQARGGQVVDDDTGVPGEGTRAQATGATGRAPAGSTWQSGSVGAGAGRTPVAGSIPTPPRLANAPDGTRVRGPDGNHYRKRGGYLVPENAQQ